MFSSLFRWSLLLFCGFFLLGIVFLASPQGDRILAETRPAFELPATDGTQISLPAKNPPRLRVFCFLGTECPLAKLYGPRLQNLAEKYASEEVRFLGIDSNRQDSREELRDYVKQHDITFPVVKDYDNKVADYYEATRTPEVIVLDERGKIRYRGRIDDQYEPGITRTKPSRNDLDIAIGELLAREPVSVAETEPAGCLIGKNPVTETPTDVTYCREVSRILQKHCVECHREGEIGPFSLTEYQEVIGWGEMMLEVIEQGRMPPWHANPKFGQFANARHMPEEDKTTLRKWVAGGMPFGEEDERPDPYESVEGWQLPRKPDQILKMNQTAFEVPAQGVVEYQYFVVDPGFSEDQWIKAAQVIPGNPEVVHHCIVFIRPPDGTDFRGAGFLSGYVPGQRAAVLPPGRARRIPKGSRLVFQMHYTPTGTPESDLTKIGILLAEEKDVTHEVVTLTALNQDFEIPPRASRHAVAGGISRLPEKGEILAITPHMHYRGKSFRVWADRTNAAEVLLDVPQYEFNWQHIYELADPLPVGDIEKLRFRAVFDNSKANPFNPDPERHVTWGDQTWEEMAIAFFEVAIPRGKKKFRRRRSDADQSETNPQKITKFVDRFFDRFDTNRDGVIRRSELPLSLGRFGMRRLDKDGNGDLDRQEIRNHAAKRDL